jgi:hypothetical protein
MSKSAKRFFSTITLSILLISIFSWQSPGASGATLVQVSDTLNRIKAGVSSTHTIIFKAPSGLYERNKIKISFVLPGGFNFGGATSTFAITDLDLATSTALAGTYTDHTLTAGITSTVGSIAFASSTSGNELLFTFYNDSSAILPSSTYFRIRIGTNASTGGAGATNLLNPAAATSSLVTIVTTNQNDTVIDRGYLSLAIVADDQINVTASVLSNLTFNWAATSTNTSVNGEGTTCASSNASTTNKNVIDFGYLTPAVAEIACQRLWVATNAANGFSVTSEQNHNLYQLGSTTQDIDSFKDGVAPIANTSGTWTTPTGVTSSELTFGHFGFTSSDGEVSSSTSNMFAGTKYAGYSGNNVPFEVFYHDSPVNSTSSGDGVGYADIVYKIQITALQEAGDYSNTIEYVATAVF